MSRRTWAIAIFAAWGLSLGWLVKREYFRSTGARLAEAALSVPPGALFYRLDLGGQQVGFASSTVDTLPDSIRVEDVLVLDVAALGTLHRTSARSVAILNRALRLRTVTTTFEGDLGEFGARGEVLGDSVLRLTITSGGDSQTTRIPLAKPITLPTLMPVRLAFGGDLRPGKTYSVRLFDPLLLAERDVTVRVASESTLVVADSADLDSTTMAWVPVHHDTVRAFRLDQETPGGGRALSAWIDAQGRLVRATTPVGFTMERSAFEIAYENFRRRDTARVARASAAPRRGDVIATTAIGAGRRLEPEQLVELRVRVTGVDLAAFDLAGGRQRLVGDTLVVTRQPVSPRRVGMAARDTTLARYLAPEPLIESSDPRIVAQARQIVGRARSPARAAELLTHWVYEHVEKEITISMPSAVQVLAARRGDCNEHAALYVALARASGLPARTAAGLVYLRGQFYYHAWPEVYLGEWIAVDPTFDQFPADAAHLRFTIGGLARQVELIRLIGKVRLEVV